MGGDEDEDSGGHLFLILKSVVEVLTNPACRSTEACSVPGPPSHC